MITSLISNFISLIIRNEVTLSQLLGLNVILPLLNELKDFKILSHVFAIESKKMSPTESLAYAFNFVLKNFYFSFRSYRDFFLL